MPKGSNGKPKTLGRLIFGDKRKQHHSPPRHRSATRNPTEPAHKTGINLHEWAVWRTQLNEQMALNQNERVDPKLMREYLQANQFYQQHSRDPSTGRHISTRLLFSIPHPKVKSEFVEYPHHTKPTETGHSLIQHRDIATSNADSSIASLLSNTKPHENIRKQELPSSSEVQKPRLQPRSSYFISNRVNSTLQKSVKDGNVLEKIKAFEMQAAAAAQAETTVKLIPNGSANHRVHPMAQTSFRALSPPTRYPTCQNPIPSSSGQRNRHVQQVIPTADPKKGSHVLEPAHGDIILKRRTPSQRTLNEEDYSTTMISSMGVVSPSHGQHHRHRHQNHQHHHHHHHGRTSVSRSRHRHESGHESRRSHHKEKTNAKTQPKTKSPTKTDGTTPSKTSSRMRWLRGKKETTVDNGADETKTELKTNKKSKKESKNKKKQNEETKTETSSKDPTNDNNHVYGVPSLGMGDEPTTTAATIEAPVEQVPAPSCTNDEEFIQDDTVEDVTHSIQVERRSNTDKPIQQKHSSTDGDILDKVDDENRYSRPTDDHAHRSEIIDEDDESKSDGDVFIEEPLAKAVPQPIVPPIQSSIRLVRSLSSQTANEKCVIERRWHWSKESGGLIDKGNRQTVPEKSLDLPKEVSPSLSSNETERKASSQVPIIEEIDTEKFELKSTTNSVHEENPEHNEDEQEKIDHRTRSVSMTDDFFDNGPLTNPEETIAKLSLST